MRGFHSKNNVTVSVADHIQSRRKRLPAIILAFFMLSGILFAFRDLMAGDVCLMAAGAAGTMAILAYMGPERDSRFGRGARLTVYGAGAAGFLILLPFVAGGFLDTVNRLITLWNLRFDTEGRLFQASGGWFASVVFWILFAMALSVFLASRILRRQVGFLGLLLSGALLFAFTVGQSGGWETVLFLGLGILGAFLYAAVPGRFLQWRGTLCMFMAGVAVLGMAVASGGYNGLEALSRWKLEVQDWAERLRYGEDTLPKGKLERAQELLSSEEETLQLSLEHPQELYLRGFVGSVYQKDRWTPLVWADYQGEYEGILEWLKGQDFIPMAQYARYDRLNTSQSNTVRAEVKNVGAYRKYVYLPVSVSSWEGRGIKAEKDAQFLSGKLFGTREYIFEMTDRAPTAEKFLTPQWLEEPETPEQEKYCDTESVYHSFVEDTCLKTDEETEELIRKEFFAGEEETEDFAQTTRQIRRVLRAKAGYTPEPLRLPEGKDMVSWFLKEAKAGNAVHFATAAVMAYRTAGYPARYVEGYHLTEARAEEMEREGQKSVTLTGEDAHAWVEVYLFGAGWLPVEVTPGMYTEFYTEQIVEGKPSYQVGTHREGEGLNLEEGESHAREEKEEKPEKKEEIPGFVPATLLLLFYLVFFVFLLLEAQRAVRIFLRRRKGGLTEGQAGWQAGRLERLLKIAGVRGDYSHPFEIEEQVEACLPGIRRADYRRAVELLQKEEFGAHTLREGEKYTLRRFEERLKESLCQKRGPVLRLRLRYWYALEKYGS